MLTKQHILDFAEGIDALRVVPRVLLFAYGAFSMWYIKWVVQWFMILPAAERTFEVMGFVSGTITAVLGGVTWYASTYTNGGRTWSK